MEDTAGQAQSAAYTVKSGDTLYSIAFRAGMDYRKVAAANGIADPYTIYPGQMIRLHEEVASAPIAVMPQASEPAPGFPARPTPILTQAPTPIDAHGSSSPVYSPAPAPSPQGAAVSESSAANTSQPVVSVPNPVPVPVPVPAPVPPPTAMPAPTATPDPTPAPTPGPTSAPAATSNPDPAAETARAEVKKQVAADTYAGDEVEVWLWPTAGPVTRGYSESVHKGIDIGGARGEPVVAVAAGKVVYSGTGIVGFGELLIIKHNDTYLSAYGHNDRLLVTEGQTVAAGQTIAEKGSSGTDTVKLHFEIRKEGKPIDPQRVLPRR
jgi:lipoprotein NlpD